MYLHIPTHHSPPLFLRSYLDKRHETRSLQSPLVLQSATCPLVNNDGACLADGRAEIAIAERLPVALRIARKALRLIFSAGDTSEKDEHEREERAKSDHAESSGSSAGDHTLTHTQINRKLFLKNLI